MTLSHFLGQFGALNRQGSSERLLAEREVRGGLPCEAYVNWHEAQGLAVEVQTLGACTTPDDVYVGVLATPVQAAA